MSLIDDTQDTGRKLTGWHVLAISVLFFGIIIAVNVFMAVKAVGTFPGLETKNSYVASQQFNDDLTAQRALGWEVTATYSHNQLMVTILDTESEEHIQVAEIGGILGRATHVLDDQTPEFRRAMTGAYVADVGDLDFGKWELRLTATADDGTAFRQLIELYVPKS